MEVESGHCVLAYQTPFLPLAACAQELSKVSRNACGPFYKLRRYGSGQIPRRRLLEFACHLDALDQIDDESGINQVGPSCNKTDARVMQSVPGRQIYQK